MHRDWIQRVKDILICSENILAFTQGMGFEAFSADPKTIRAVAFELTTLGEATKAIPEEVQNRYPDVPWEKMRAIRNVIIHEYFRLDEEILWKTSQDDIPELISKLKTILADQE